ncbi:hypothetical protein [Synechococcus sp. ROS8604]|uniref:hypothetical protein n=1 Tax=Synechococcus sp. ROS8604 TaxID=1442557 RepID=UPI00210684CF|nr:hypothetical protein [Synechococcus sp. ROS8604]
MNRTFNGVTTVPSSNPIAGEIKPATDSHGPMPNAPPLPSPLGWLASVSVNSEQTLRYLVLKAGAAQVAGKSGFTQSEFEEIKRLYVEEGRTFSQIAKVIGKGSENSVRNSLSKARVNRASNGERKLERFKSGQKYGNITLLTRLVKSKKLRYHVVCDCGYEFDIDPYFLTLPDDHKNSISQCQRCRAGK